MKKSGKFAVLPGLVASRRANRIEIMAECTGLNSGEAAEFLLIDQTSSHGYEAMLWSYARPSDVHKALVFLGLKPGQSFSPDNLRFWAEGELVIVSVVTSKGEFKDKPFRIEQLILDTQTEKTLPEDGFVFTGSMTLPPPPGATEPIYVADTYDPKSVASIYNEPSAVLDLPRRASQGEVYGRQVANPDRKLTRGELITIMLVPEVMDETRRVRNFVLDVMPGATANNSASESTNRVESLSRLAFILNEEDGSSTNERTSLAATVARLAALVDDGRTPYVVTRFDRALTLSDIRNVALVLALSEEKLGIRIKAPEAGHIYYKAFLPEVTWRKPDARPSQPWELHIGRNDGTLSGQMILNELYWTSQSLNPVVSNITFAVTSPGAIRERIDAEDARRTTSGKAAVPAVLFVFADKKLTYGELLDFMAPALKTHNTVYVFFPLE